MTAPSMGGTAAGFCGGTTSPALMQCEAKQTVKKADRCIMGVCMYKYMYVCMYVRMNVCMGVCMYVCKEV